MEKPKRRVPEWRKEARVGLIVTLSAALFFGGIYAIANTTRKPDISDSTGGTIIPPSIVIDDGSDGGGAVVDPVHDPLNEALLKPFNVSTEIAHYFYEQDDDLDTRSQSIVAVPGKTDTYQKSLGVDYVYQSNFQVIAACSGIVKEKVNDATYGNMLLIEHPSGLLTIYSSLGEVNVTKGAEVVQGDVIADSGESLYTSGLGESLHFEVIKDEAHLNPEKMYSQHIREM